MSIEQNEIEKIAELARIRISGEQLGQVTQRITEILAMVDQLQAADTRNVEPMANPLDAIQCLRPDEVTESNRREAFQALAGELGRIARLRAQHRRRFRDHR